MLQLFGFFRSLWNNLSYIGRFRSLISVRKSMHSMYPYVVFCLLLNHSVGSIVPASKLRTIICGVSAIESPLGMLVEPQWQSGNWQRSDVHCDMAESVGITTFDPLDGFLFIFSGTNFLSRFGALLGSLVLLLLSGAGGEFACWEAALSSVGKLSLVPCHLSLALCPDDRSVLQFKR